MIHSAAPLVMAETARSVAAAAVGRVLQQQASLDTALQPTLSALSVRRDQALAREIASGTVRWGIRLQAILQQLCKRPPDTIIQALIMTGMYQLSRMRIADHAAISETVRAARILGRSRSSAFVNAVLRRYQREQQQLEKMDGQPLHVRHAYPEWMARHIAADWPGQHEAVLAAGNQRAPMWLRIDPRHTTVEELSAQLGQPVQQHPFVNTAVYPEKPVPVERIPGFDTGHVSVQDAAAQLAAPLLEPGDGMRVLDACAAPGGKTTHLLQMASIDLTAIDIDAQRLQRVADNLQRCGLAATLLDVDLRDYRQWWDGVAFDRILLDAPCTATGVIRRHPDIKLLRRQSDVAELAEMQLQLLRACWAMLAPGGRLLYATCSILQQENDATIDTFLSEQQSARSVAPDIPWGYPGRHGHRLLPGETATDGFYYSCLEHS